MKYLLLTIIFSLCFLQVWTQEIIPNHKVTSAFTKQELATKTQAEILDLNIIADHLCWFEDIKADTEGEVFQLIDKKGNSVVLSESDLIFFNPLLYNIPQEDFKCGNLVIMTAEGNRHLLVVRSVSMMQTKLERVKKQMAK